MIPDLAVEDFETFFHEVHGCPPFPWQERLIRQVTEMGRWPKALDLPTGSGKTAALDVAVFHLALEAHRQCERCAPVRIVLVVDRRLVVDDAFKRARKIADVLREAKPESVTGHVAHRLQLLAGEGNPPLLARRLRGGIPREDDWARTPSQPTIVCSTVDQIGSRLLFRGYGISDSMKPVHAGLIGADCLILLDEAHLSESFRQTLEWVGRYKTAQWRASSDRIAPWGVSLLTATPGAENVSEFHLEDDDYANSILGRRWTAPKPARLIDIAKVKSTNAEPKKEDYDEDENGNVEEQRVEVIVSEAINGIKVLQDSGVQCPALAVVVNRVARARKVFERLQEISLVEGGAIDVVDLTLMIGPARPLDRDFLAEMLEPIRTGNRGRVLPTPSLLVSTQCIEVGVDIDLDGLVTEAAPLDALRQRFGRLNRDGREITPYAAVIGHTKADKKDRVYDEAIGHSWAYLVEHADEPARKKSDAKVDFGLRAFHEKMQQFPVPGEALAPTLDAPILLPAHLDLLSHTAPIPNADPEVSLYLHGPDRAADTVSVVWRADFDPAFRKLGDARRLLLLTPPRSAEAIELPVWIVRQWLAWQKVRFSNFADIPTPEPEEERSQLTRENRMVFRWAGDDDHSTWIEPSEIRPGDTIIVPASYGGVDEYGWNPTAESATDVADKAAEPFATRRFVVRIAPGLLNDISLETRLSQVIASEGTPQWQSLREAIKRIDLPNSIVENLYKLDSAKGKKGRNKVEVHTDLYGTQDGCPRGVVFVAPFGIAAGSTGVPEEGGGFGTTEDDISGSLPGFALPLKQHCEMVERMAERFAQLAGLAEDRIADVKIAAYLHDAGKVDPRFQAWLVFGDPLGPDPEDAEQVLAKSARPLPPSARASSGLPEKWRHEALSVRLAAESPRFKNEAKDSELVLWLIGTHHGYGRPFFPHSDPADCEPRSGLSSVLGTPPSLAAGPGPQSLAYNWHRSDWPSLYERLKARYGVWELARMEAILRLADHRASEDAGRKLADGEVAPR
jgi:CRISPR-associated endonuclease/helicase Cas3